MLRGPLSVGLIYIDETPQGIPDCPPKALVVAWRTGYRGMIAKLHSMPGLGGDYTYRLFRATRGHNYQELHEDEEGVLGTVYICAEWICELKRFGVAPEVHGCYCLQFPVVQAECFLVQPTLYNGLCAKAAGLLFALEWHDRRAILLHM